MENKIFEKNIIKFKDPIDFNTISKIMDRGNLKSEISSNWLQQYVFNAVIKIMDLEQDPMFYGLYKHLNENYNPENFNANLYAFISFKMGNTSITHRDPYDVIIIGAHGETIYNLEGKEYRVCPGDLLKITKGVTHTAIGMTPRIILSYGKYN